MNDWRDAHFAWVVEEQVMKYLPTPSEPAVIVATAPYMDQPEPRPIPEDLDEHRNTLGHQVGFVAGWLLNADDLANAQRVGIPGLQ